MNKDTGMMEIVTPNTYLIVIGLVVFLLIFLFLIFTISAIANAIGKKRQPEEVAPQPTKQPKPKKEKHNEIIDSLDWMLAHNIITTDEYNKLIVKSLPYLG